MSLWEKSNGSWSKKFERTSTIADLQGVAVISSSKYVNLILSIREFKQNVFAGRLQRFARLEKVVKFYS